MSLCAPVCVCVRAQLHECDALAGVTLAPVGLRELMLGSCPHLSNLTLDAPLLSTLDLKCAPVSLACLICQVAQWPGPWSGSHADLRTPP